MGWLVLKGRGIKMRYAKFVKSVWISDVEDVYRNPCVRVEIQKKSIWILANNKPKVLMNFGRGSLV